jgi:hypothetical protein
LAGRVRRGKLTIERPELADRRRIAEEVIADL